MTNHRTICCSLATTALVLLCGCTGPERTNPFDQARCDPACSADKVCYDGKCEDNPCPEGMVHVSRPVQLVGTSYNGSPQPTPFCIDRYEASGQLSVAQLNVASVPDAVPLIGISIGSAHAACKAHGKRLCSMEHWLMACFGPHGQGTGVGKDKDEGEEYHGPLSQHCNVSGSLHKAGGTPSCEGGYNGIFDMVGNASEWVLGCSDPGSSSCVIEVGRFMGGSYKNNQNQDPWSSGCFVGTQIDSMTDPKDLMAETGFRCCLPCEAKDPQRCQAPNTPDWLNYSLNTQDNPTLPAPQDMWGSSATDIWAAAPDPMAPTSLKVLHFDGLRWSEDAQIPCPKDECRPSIWGASAETWIAVGDLLHRRSGKTWTEVKSLPDPCPGTPDPGLRLGGIWGTSDSDIWVVGSMQQCPAAAGVAYHYDGSAWQITSPKDNPPLSSVWAASPTDVWAVGLLSAFHYDGTSWSTESNGLPTDAGWAMYEVWGSSSSDVWVIVDQQGGGGGGGSVYRYSGAWTKSTLDNDELAIALGGTSGNDIWAITTSSIQRFDGTSWQPRVPFDKSQPFDMNRPDFPRAIWAAAPDDVWFGTIHYH